MEDNPWYKNAIRIVIPIGSDVNKDLLQKIVKSSEGIIAPNNHVALKNFFRAIDMPADVVVEDIEKTKSFIRVESVDNNKSCVIKTSTQQFKLVEGEELMLKNCQLHPCSVSEALCDAFFIRKMNGTVLIKSLFDVSISADNDADYHGDKICRRLKPDSEYRVNLDQIDEFHISDPTCGWDESLINIDFMIEGKNLLIHSHQDALLTRDLIYNKETILCDGDSVESEKYGVLFSLNESQPI